MSTFFIFSLEKKRYVDNFFSFFLLFFFQVSEKDVAKVVDWRSRVQGELLGKLNP